MPRWRECQYCGRLFDAPRDDSRFCTQSHARTYEQQQKRTPQDEKVAELLRAIEAEIRRFLK